MEKKTNMDDKREDLEFQVEEAQKKLAELREQDDGVYWTKVEEACETIRKVLSPLRDVLPAGYWDVKIWDGGLVVTAPGAKRSRPAKTARRRRVRVPAAAPPPPARILRLVPLTETDGKEAS
ncbi:MAG: hypothetical protein ABIE42_10235 [Candidatus Eisenbacteria bacterium]